MKPTAWKGYSLLGGVVGEIPMRELDEAEPAAVSGGYQGPWGGGWLPTDAITFNSPDAVIIVPHSAVLAGEDGNCVEPDISAVPDPNGGGDLVNIYGGDDDDADGYVDSLEGGTITTFWAGQIDTQEIPSGPDPV